MENSTFATHISLFIMESNEEFGVVDNYWRYIQGTQTPWDCRIENGSRTWHREIFISVLENEYALRELAQRIEFLREKKSKHWKS